MSRRWSSFNTCSSEVIDRISQLNSDVELEEHLARVVSSNDILAQEKDNLTDKFPDETPRKWNATCLFWSALALSMASSAALTYRATSFFAPSHAPTELASLFPSTELASLRASVYLRAACREECNATNCTIEENPGRNCTEAVRLVCGAHNASRVEAQGDPVLLLDCAGNATRRV